jgi:hypothetical protein
LAAGGGACERVIQSGAAPESAATATAAADGGPPLGTALPKMSI